MVQIQLRTASSASFFQRMVALVTWCSSLGVVWFAETSQTPSPWRSGQVPGYVGYFRAQAEALLSGTLSVPPEVLGDECYFVDGLCFGYFGVTPSFMRIPLLALGIEGDLSPFAAAIGYLIGIAGSLWVLIGVWRVLEAEWGLEDSGYARWVFVLTALSFGPASLTLLIARPDVGNEAILWGSSWLIVTAALVIHWMRTRSALPLALSVVSATLAANARPSLLPAIIGLGVISLATARWNRWKSVASNVALLMLVAIPTVTTSMVFWIKMGTFIPDLRNNHFIGQSSFWRAIREANGDSLFSWVYIPQNAWNFLRPTALHYELTFPRGIFYRPTDSFWPAPAGGSYLEPAGSLTTFAPFLIILAVISLGPLLSTSGRPIGRYLALVFLAGSLSLGALVTWSQLAMTNRYLGDAVPSLVLAASIGSVVAARAWSQHPFVRLGFAVLAPALTGIAFITVLFVMK